MSSLIHKLNALAHLTPDEIQSQIGKLGWVKLSTMTQDQLDRFGNKPAVLVGQHDSGSFWIIRGPGDSFKMNWSLDKCHDSWWTTVNAHTCLVSEYKYGTFPS